MSFLNVFLVCIFSIIIQSKHLHLSHLRYNSTIQKVIDAACLRPVIRKSRPKESTDPFSQESQTTTTTTTTTNINPSVSPISNNSIVPLPLPAIQSQSLPPTQSLPTLFVSNPEASNWIFGDMSKIQYLNNLGELKKRYTLHKCPLQRPYSVGQKCISCPNNQIFNLKTRDCEECPPGTYFNQKQRACTIDPPLLYNTNTESSSQNYIGNPPKFDSTIKNCPQTHPFTNFTGCVECNLPRFYNYNTLKCQACPPNYSFSLKQRKCISDIIYPIVKDPKKIIIRHITNYTNIPVAVAPIIVSTIHKNTGSQPQFDPNLLSNKQLTSVKYLTSPSAPNILFGTQDLKQYRQEYSSLSKNQPTCPPEYPYFDGNKCINCSEQYPLFDLQNKQCVACPQGSQFDKQLHRCRPKVEIQPSIERFLMNIK